MRRLSCIIAVLLCACSQPGDKAVERSAKADSGGTSRDSLLTIAQLEKAFADEARLVDHATLPVEKIGGLYGARLSIAADRIIVVQADSTVQNYYVSFDANDLTESVSELEIGSLLKGIDSVIAWLARPDPPGIQRDVVYHTSGGMKIGFFDNRATGRVGHVSGAVSGNFFLPVKRMRALQDAVARASDSIRVLKQP